MGLGLVVLLVMFSFWVFYRMVMQIMQLIKIQRE